MELEWEKELEPYTHVQVSGSDIDGISRGKLMNKDKFLKSIQNGFGFCSVIFGWDMHDKTYETHVAISNKENGYADIVAKPDLSSYRPRREKGDDAIDQVPLFLLDFYNPITNQPLPMCPRSLLKSVCQRYQEPPFNFKAQCGIEFEWYNFKETPSTLAQKKGVGLEPLTQGMFGYSLLRPELNKEFYQNIFSECELNGIRLEALHTETGPGVFEAAIQYNDALSLADQAHLFKTVVKQLGLKHGIISCFMAKPWQDLAGCSGHIHISLADMVSGQNLFAQNEKDSSEDRISDLMKSFVAGLLEGLPSIMPLLAPTINSYKRLVENWWAPINLTYGYENRTAAIRLIAPPSCPPSATRLELRVSGADINPYLALSALLACGYEGIRQKMKLPYGPLEGDACASSPPLDKRSVERKMGRLPKNLRKATLNMMAKDSFARKVLGHEFVEHFGATRLHECDLYDRAVTNWELTRYMEVV